MEVRELLSKYQFPGTTPPSFAVRPWAPQRRAQVGSKVDELWKRWTSTFPVRARHRSAFLMPIEDIFSISGRGTVVTGRIERGKIKVRRAG